MVSSRSKHLTQWHRLSNSCSEHNHMCLSSLRRPHLKPGNQRTSHSSSTVKYQYARSAVASPNSILINKTYRARREMREWKDSIVCEDHYRMWKSASHVRVSVSCEGQHRMWKSATHVKVRKACIHQHRMWNAKISVAHLFQQRMWRRKAWSCDHIQKVNIRIRRLSSHVMMISTTSLLTLPRENGWNEGCLPDGGNWFRTWSSESLLDHPVIFKNEDTGDTSRSYMEQCDTSHVRYHPITFDNGDTGQNSMSTIMKKSQRFIIFHPVTFIMHTKKQTCREQVSAFN